MEVFRMTAVVEKDEDGYFAFCPELQGCYTQGATHEEALDNLRDAVKLHLADRKDSGESVKKPSSVTLTTLEVTV